MSKTTTTTDDEYQVNETMEVILRFGNNPDEDGRLDAVTEILTAKEIAFVYQEGECDCDTCTDMFRLLHIPMPEWIIDRYTNEHGQIPMDGVEAFMDTLFLACTKSVGLGLHIEAGMYNGFELISSDPNAPVLGEVPEDSRWDGSDGFAGMPDAKNIGIHTAEQARDFLNEHPDGRPDDGPFKGMPIAFLHSMAMDRARCYCEECLPIQEGHEGYSDEHGHWPSGPNGETPEEWAKITNQVRSAYHGGRDGFTMTSHNPVPHGNYD
jgi:hypothetical protein